MGAPWGRFRVSLPCYGVCVTGLRINGGSNRELARGNDRPLHPLIEGEGVRGFVGLAMTIGGSDYLVGWRRGLWAQASNLGSGIVLMTSDLPSQARRAVATPRVMFSN